MTPAMNDETAIRRYLLGRLGSQPQDDVERRLFSEDEVFWERLCLVEEELIDDYVRGRLDDEERADFERHFLSTDERRQKLEFARALRAHVASRQAHREGLWHWLRRPIVAPGWAVATAATLLLLLPGLAWQFASGPRAARDVTASLSAGLVRDVGGELTRVRIPPGCEVVRLEIDPGPSTYAGYRATISEVTGDELWAQGKLSAQAGASGPVVVLTLPCVLLTDADYFVRLYGVAPGTAPVPLHRYDFRVIRE